MEQVQTCSPNYGEDIFASLNSALKRGQDYLILLFRYALPFLLIDLLSAGIVSLIFFGPRLVSSFAGAGVGTGSFLYCCSFVLLVGLHKGVGSRRSKLFILLYVGFVFVFLIGIVYIVFMRVGMLGILGGFFWYLIWNLSTGLVLVTVLTNFIFLPLLNIGLVFGKRFAKTIERCLPWLFPGIASMNFRESLVRGSCSLLLVSGFGYATLIEPNIVWVEEIDIRSDKVIEEVTILHLTDMHIDSIGYHERKLFRQIQELNPDIIVQTGDLLDLYNPEEWDKEHMNELADLFRQLTPKYGLYWIVGNHDYGLEKIDWFYERAGVTLLHDDEHVVSGSFGRLSLLGLSWRKSYWDRDKAFIENWLNAIGKDEFTIVMGHAPDYILDIVDLDIDLALAGHLHGGQVGIPGLQTLLLTTALQAIGSDFPAEWAAGYRELEHLRINVSAGTGSHGPARVLCPPTMTLFTIGGAL
ncbi:MAG: hypothetical protein GY801_09290 [bacterium]|nr:hypothetical protein [bacterium]